MASEFSLDWKVPQRKPRDWILLFLLTLVRFFYVIKGSLEGEPYKRQTDRSSKTRGFLPTNACHSHGKPMVWNPNACDWNFDIGSAHHRCFRGNNLVRAVFVESDSNASSCRQPPRDQTQIQLISKDYRVNLHWKRAKLCIATHARSTPRFELVAWINVPFIEKCNRF